MKKHVGHVLLPVMLVWIALPAPAQTFTQSQFASAGQRVFGIRTADVNNDGKLDLIAISEPTEASPYCAGNANGENSRDLVVHLGNGDGSFGAPTVLHSQSCWQSDSVVEVEVVDVNKDGKADLVYAGGDTLGIMLGNGDGTFQVPNLFHAVTLGSTNGDVVNSLAAADFDNDGKVDFVVSTTEYLEFFFGNGDGTVHDPELLDTVDPTVGTFGSTRPGNFDVEAGDFNHDGNADIAFVWCCDPFEQTNRLYAFFGDGHGISPSWILVSYLGSLTFGGSLSVADINGDGFADILGSVGYPITFLSDGNYGLSLKTGSTQYGISYTLSWGDFNGDGVLDLVSAFSCASSSGCTSGVIIWPQTADGSMLSPQKVDIDAPSGVGDVIAGDFNGDGKADIAAVVDRNQIAVLINACTSSCTTIDATSPDTAITSAVDGSGAVLSSGGVTFATSVTFAFTGTDNVGVTGFECRLDASAFAACTSPISYVGLGVGTHLFQVRAVDAAGNRDTTPAGFSFVINSVPDTSIVSVIDSTGTNLVNGAATLSISVTIAFSGSSNIGVSRFECRMDSAGFATCASPVAVGGLSLGRHEFAVRAVDTSGFADPTPATFALIVDAVPDTSITSATDNTGRTVMNGGSMRGSSITFRFSGTDNNAVAGFECSRDNSAFAQCTSPVTYSVTSGTHSFRVRAVDNAGFRDPTPALFTWSK